MINLYSVQIIILQHLSILELTLYTRSASKSQRSPASTSLVLVLNVCATIAWLIIFLFSWVHEKKNWLLSWLVEGLVSAIKISCLLLYWSHLGDSRETRLLGAAYFVFTVRGLFLWIGPHSSTGIHRHSSQLSVSDLGLRTVLISKTNLNINRSKLYRARLLTQLALILRPSS